MRFRSRYTIAISLIIILLFSNQIVIQYWLNQKGADAYVINISGKQRMLSQKIWGLISYYKDNPTSETVKLEIQDTFEEWKSVHELLVKGDKEKGINLSKDITAELDKITPNIKYLHGVMIDLNQLEDKDISDLKENQSTFLRQMDNIVGLIEENSDQKLQNIVEIEFILAIVTLFVIFLEIQFIFRPIIAQLELRNKELNERTKVLEEYAYIASHDLRTPIRNLLNFLGLLKKSILPKLDKKEQYYLEFVEDSANRMNETTKDLLDYSVANKINVEKSDTNGIVEEVLEDISTQIEEKKATIEVSNMPKDALVDYDLFRLLMQNLITNGLKFVAEDKVPHVKVWSVTDKHHHYFHVKDNGIGISEEHQEQIFKIFQRLHNQEEYQGTGIGLALCKRIVEGHGGKIWVESKENKGSTFMFKIPK